MADSGSVTQTGVREMRAALERLPDAVTAALKGVALQTAERIRATAADTLLAKTASDKTPETQAIQTAAAIKVTVDDVQKVVYVTSAGVAGDPANNPIWLEHGTVHQAAKAYMRPATDQHAPYYLSESAKAANRTVEDLLT
jgi:hypothetical protein